MNETEKGETEAPPPNGKLGDLSTYLGNDLNLLPLTQLTLPHRRLQPSHHPLLQLGRTCNNQLHLPTVRAHQLSELLTHPLQQSQPVILRQRLQEVLDGPALVGASRVLLQLGDDGRFVRFGQGGRMQDGGEFAVGF